MTIPVLKPSEHRANIIPRVVVMDENEVDI